MNTSSEIRLSVGMLRIDREVVWLGLEYVARPASYWLNDEPISREQAEEILSVASGLPNVRFVHG
jgi:hypothetical protein